MVYLDYAANTPVDEVVLEAFCKINREYYGNANAKHAMGEEANHLIKKTSESIKEMFSASQMEVIYTSGASEGNNLAIKGIARAYRENGKHIISTCLEHSSVSGALTYLQNLGYEIDLVDIKEDGTVNLNHLKELLRTDTVLVSIAYVDSELGVVQPMKEIGELVAEYPNCYFHVDATQAVGKILVHCDNIDCLTFTPHKFYGLNGMGVLLRREGVILDPQIHGGDSTSIYRSGTPVPAFATAIYEALSLSIANIEERYNIVLQHNNWLKQQMEKYPLVRMNSPRTSLPYFLNLSVKGIKAAVFQKALNEKQIYLSTKSACSTPNTPSRAVFAVTKDRKNAMCSWRISLSYLTTKEELLEFMKAFEACYKELTETKK